jgi:hypothetical protein
LHDEKTPVRLLASSPMVFIVIHRPYGDYRIFSDCHEKLLPCGNLMMHGGIHENSLRWKDYEKIGADD